jgi:hypothetical protein
MMDRPLFLEPNVIGLVTRLWTRLLCHSSGIAVRQSGRRAAAGMSRRHREECGNGNEVWRGTNAR